MTVFTLVQFLGVLFGSSIACFALENVAVLHPIAKRGAQVGICALAGMYIGRVFGVI